jgi:hypothetical protein
MSTIRHEVPSAGLLLPVGLRSDKLRTPSHIIRFVGRNKTAMAASTSDIRRLSLFQPSIDPPAAVTEGSYLVTVCFWSKDKPLPTFSSRKRAHGQYARAAMVKVVSSELEKVLVEQYHCQGLSTVIHNCTWSAKVPR